MAIWKKKDEDISGIKDAINRPKPGLEDMPAPKEKAAEPREMPVPEPAGPKPAPVPPMSMPRTQLPPAPPRRQDVIRDPVVSRFEGQDDSAHVFVKLDRYDAILSKLDSLKDIIQHLTDVMMTNLDIDRVKSDISVELKSSLDMMSESLASLDGEFLRPEDSDEYSRKHDPKLEKIRGDIEELKKRVTQL